MNTAKAVRKKNRPVKPPASGGGRPSAPTTPPAVNFFTQVYAVVRLIPKGQVATYGDIAAIAVEGNAGRIRQP